MAPCDLQYVHGFITTVKIAMPRVKHLVSPSVKVTVTLFLGVVVKFDFDTNKHLSNSTRSAQEVLFIS